MSLSIEELQKIAEEAVQEAEKVMSEAPKRVSVQKRRYMSLWHVMVDAVEIGSFWPEGNTWQWALLWYESGQDFPENVCDLESMIEFLVERSLQEFYPSYEYIDIRAKKYGPPQSSDRFIQNAEYRDMPDLRCGDRVRVGHATGVVKGHNSSANFDVLFDEDSGYPDEFLSVHPNGMEVLK